MTKTFCDNCNAEIEYRLMAAGSVSRDGQVTKVRPFLKNPKFKIEAVNMNGGHETHADLCWHCILDALFALDDRPKVALEAPVEQGEPDKKE